MRSLTLLLGIGVGLVIAATVIGGRGAAIGGGVAVIAQTWAVLLLQPAMRAPNPQFMVRWLGGMGIRFLALAVLMLWVITHRASIAPLPAFLGFLGVLLPLLFLETRFLR